MGARRPLSTRNTMSPKVAVRLIRECSSFLDLLAGIARLRGWRGAASILSSKRVRSEKKSNIYILLSNPLFEVGAAEDILNYFNKLSLEYQYYYWPETKDKLEKILVN